MSGWNAYIQSLLSSSSEVRRAAIVGSSDGSVWARTEGDNEFKVDILIIYSEHSLIWQYFEATEAELKKFITHFDDLQHVPTTGADLEG